MEQMKRAIKIAKLVSDGNLCGYLTRVVALADDSLDASKMNVKAEGDERWILE